jgi:hypothetical protein
MKLEANLYVFQAELAYLIVLSISSSVGHLRWLKVNFQAVTQLLVSSMCFRTIRLQLASQMQHTPFNTCDTAGLLFEHG